MPTSHKISVKFSDRNTPVEPPDGEMIAKAIRLELEELRPSTGDVVLWHGNYPGWEPLSGNCWVHGVAGGTGDGHSLKVESHVRVVLERLGQLAKS